MAHICSGIDFVRLESPSSLVCHHAGFTCPSCKVRMYACCISYLQGEFEDSRVYSVALACHVCSCYWVEWQEGPQ